MSVSSTHTSSSTWERWRKEWFGQPRQDILSGMVVALALIPEAIAFSIIAGVDPKVGIYASFCIAVVIAFIGGRPAMISAATGAMALVMVTLVRDHGLEYLLACSILTGVLQFLMGVFKLVNLISFVSKSVVTGFVNALAILYFITQMNELQGASWEVYTMTAAGLGIIYLFPYVPVIGKMIPSPLICVIVLTIFSVTMGLDIGTVGDKGDLPDSLPIFLLPDVPVNFETFKIIFPYAFALAFVGLLESLMTATILDDLTDTESDKNKECRGQGIANICAASLGGMAGCAMIGQSVINVKTGGRGRLSTFTAGALLLLMVVFTNEWVAQIPMAALIAVMLMVSFGTMDWQSVKNIKSYPLSTNVVMITTVAIVVYTHNLAIGVFVGVLLASLFFANKVSHFMYVESEKTGDDERTYRVHGQVFFNSADKFRSKFDFKESIDKVVIDLTHAHFWDVSAVSALDAVKLKFRREGADVEVIGLNKASATVIDRFGMDDNKEDIDKVLNDH